MITAKFPGNAAPTKTRISCCGNASREAPTYPSIRKRNSTRSRCARINAQEKPSASKLLQVNCKPVLRRPSEPAAFTRHLGQLPGHSEDSRVEFLSCSLIWRGLQARPYVYRNINLLYKKNRWYALPYLRCFQAPLRLSPLSSEVTMPKSPRDRQPLQIAWDSLCTEDFGDGAIGLCRLEYAIGRKILHVFVVRVLAIEAEFPSEMIIHFTGRTEFGQSRYPRHSQS